MEVVAGRGPSCPLQHAMRPRPRLDPGRYRSGRISEDHRLQRRRRVLQSTPVRNAGEQPLGHVRARLRVPRASQVEGPFRRHPGLTQSQNPGGAKAGGRDQAPVFVGLIDVQAHRRPSHPGGPAAHPAGDPARGDPDHRARVERRVGCPRGRCERDRRPRPAPRRHRRPVLDPRHEGRARVRGSACKRSPIASRTSS